MVTVLALLGVLAVLFVTAVLSTREGPVMADAPQDAADLDLPDGPLQPADVRALRFGLAPRGYRMSEVDAVLERMSAELADRDRRIALLEAAVEGSPGVREAGAVDLPLAAEARASTSGPAAGLVAPGSLERSGGSPDLPLAGAAAPAPQLVQPVQPVTPQAPPGGDRPPSP